VVLRLKEWVGAAVSIDERTGSAAGPLIRDP